MFNDRCIISGRCRIYNTDTGELLVDAHNIVVNGGLTHIRDCISGYDARPGSMSHIAAGSSNDAASAGQTALHGELHREAVACTEPSAYVVRYTAVFAAGDGTGNWYEAGIFNDAAAGTMLCRVTFGLLTKAAADSFTIQYDITISDDGV